MCSKSMNRTVAKLGMISLVLYQVACGFDGPQPPGARPVEVENQSQFSLEELRVHRDLDYRGARNLLLAPLLPGTRTSTVLEGSFYVTVFRERARGAKTIALTSEQALEIVDAPSFLLLVFDESFRLIPSFAGPAP